MRIYHHNTLEIFGDFGNEGKTMRKKKYKSVNSLQHYSIRVKALGEKGSDSVSQKKKKKLLKKNIRFLESIGLKVKKN